MEVVRREKGGGVKVLVVGRQGEEGWLQRTGRGQRVLHGDGGLGCPPPAGGGGGRWNGRLCT